MNDEAAGSSETTESELALEHAIRHAVAQPGRAGEDQTDTGRLQATLRNLVGSAEHWRRVSDLQPYLAVFRDFGMSSLSLLIDNLPQHQRLRQLLPPNWRDKPDLDLDKALNLINNGVPLIWVPEAAIVSDLLAAGDSAERSGILEGLHGRIGHSCLIVLSEVSDSELTTLVEFAADAAQALVAGNFRVAQALAGNVLDTWLREAARRGVFGKQARRFRYDQVTTGIQPLTSDTLLEWFREICVLAPVAVALRNYQAPDPTPRIFNRHATAHAVGHVQYAPTNAVISVMLISSVLREAEESGL